MPAGTTISSARSSAACRAIRTTSTRRPIASVVSAGGTTSRRRSNSGSSRRSPPSRPSTSGCTRSRQECCARPPPACRSHVKATTTSSIGGERLHLELDSLRHAIAGSLRDRDALTGAYGRVEMLPTLREWRELARRNVQQCCIAFMDLDHLKEINDRHGHVVGDQVLAGVVRHVTEHLRPYDKVFRYGGDEFLISLPGADLEIGKKVIGHIREQIAAAPHIESPAGHRGCHDRVVRARVAGTRHQRRGLHRPRGQGLAGGQGRRAQSRVQLGSCGHDRHSAAANVGGRRSGLSGYGRRPSIRWRRRFVLLLLLPALLLFLALLLRRPLRAASSAVSNSGAWPWSLCPRW